MQASFHLHSRAPTYTHVNAMTPCAEAFITHMLCTKVQRTPQELACAHAHMYAHAFKYASTHRSVKLLQTLAQLGVCMHEPGKNQEGFSVGASCTDML